MAGALPLFKIDMLKKAPAALRFAKKVIHRLKQMKNNKNLKSQVKKSKVIHRGAKFAPHTSAKFAPRINKKFLKKMRASYAYACESFRIGRKPASLSRATLISFSDCTGLKDGNGLLTTRRTLRAEILGKEYRGIF